VYSSISSRKQTMQRARESVVVISRSSVLLKTRYQAIKTRNFHPVEKKDTISTFSDSETNKGKKNKPRLQAGCPYSGKNTCFQNIAQTMRHSMRYMAQFADIQRRKK
jgi:hypothetical protein